MRSLFVSTHFPDDFSTQTYGVFRRLDLFVSALSRICSRLDILFYTPPAYVISENKTLTLQKIYAARWGGGINLFLVPSRARPPNASKISHYLSPIFDIRRQRSYYYASGIEQIRAFEALLSRGHDYLFMHRLYGMMPLLLTKKSTPPVFLDLDEVEHRWLYDNISQPPHWPGKKLLYLQIPALYMTEKKALRRAKRTFVCSESDRDYLIGRWNLSNVSQVQNAMSVPLPETLTTAKTLLFLGSFAYEPNVLAASVLIERIWPDVLASVPDARLFIVGEHPDKIPAYRSAPTNVVFTGFVPDLDALYRDVRCVVCPIQSGGGTRLKVIEGALRGKAIVCTAIGATGLGLQDNKHLLIRDKHEDFVAACVSLLNRYDEAARLGSSARNRGIDLYDKEKIAAEVCRQIAFDLQG